MIPCMIYPLIFSPLNFFPFESLHKVLCSSFVNEKEKAPESLVRLIKVKMASRIRTKTKLDDDKKFGISL